MAKRIAKRKENVVEEPIKVMEELNTQLDVVEEKVTIDEISEEFVYKSMESVESVEKKENHQNLFSIDVSSYGIELDEAEKLINNAIKFYYDNKDKNFVEDKPLTSEVDHKEKGIHNMIAEYEKSVKFFNFIPKAKVLSFLKSLKEKLQ